jgi:uncharacterized protein YbbC (DUF1343 family)
MSRVMIATESVEQIEKLWPLAWNGLRLGAVLHPASVNFEYKHSLDILREVPASVFSLTTLFGPQHGIRGELQDNMFESDHGVDPKTGLPVWSLYSERREPSAEMLQNLDVLLIDLQDVGSRYYTFIWTMYLCMRACEKVGKKMAVVDRPNPIGNKVEGPILELSHPSFVGLWKIPARHGKTIGELALQFKEECFPNLDLVVLPMQNHQPQVYFDKTELPWVLPSPNMPTLETAVVYPGMCLLEACNLSEGRGTTKPFEIFGAPWLNSQGLVEYLNAQNFAGVVFREHHFLPTFHKYSSPLVAGWNDEVFDKFRGQVCHGAQIHVTDRNLYPAFEVGVAILRYAFHTHPEYFRWRPAKVGYEYEFEKLGIDMLLGNGWYRTQEIENKK